MTATCMEGGAGVDTAEVNGGNGAEIFTATANGERVRFDRVDPAPFALDIGTTENLVVNMNGGDDTFSATGNLSSLIRSRSTAARATTRSSAATATTCCSAATATTSSTATRERRALLGAGDDVFQWDPGDGSDVVEGQDGIRHAAVQRQRRERSSYDLRERRARALLRNVGNIVMDTE